MKNAITKSLLLCFTTLVGVQIVQSQQLILYKESSMERPYVLTQYYPLADKTIVSEVIIFETYSVKPVNSKIELTMSNAIDFKTNITRDSSPSAGTSVKQQTIRSQSIVLTLDKSDKIICNGSTIVLGSFWQKNDGDSPALKKEYEGKAAEQYLKENGLGLPPDYIGK